MAVCTGAGNITGPASTVNPLRDAWGIAMGKGKPRGGRKLAVRVTYEGSRLSADCLAQAYERFVPVARAGPSGDTAYSSWTTAMWRKPSVSTRAWTISWCGS